MATYASYYLPKNEHAPVMLGSLSEDDVLRDCWYAGTMYRAQRCSRYLCPVVDRPGARKSSMRSPIIDPTQIDFDVPRRWIEHCLEHHSTSCGIKSRVVDFVVIDCENNTLVPAKTSCKYLALSYMWGLPKSESRNNVSAPEVFPDNIPPTISDAISITRQLGYRYLWVDRYCIRQEESSEKAVQIGRMDSIYQGAIATLVAVVGDSPAFGLPGAGTGKARRTPQLSGEISGHKLVSTYGDPQDLVLRSKWMTRGWTLQEAILSRRLLIFTEEQLYFECAGMVRCEAAEYTIAPNPPLPIFSQDAVWSLFEQLQEYSKRNLSYEYDALNGFLGILRSYQTLENPVYHIWGSPIPSLPTKDLSRAFVLGMFWAVKIPHKRRIEFPSWTWAGWKGELHHWVASVSCKWASLKEDWTVVVEAETSDGTILSLEDLETSGRLFNNLTFGSHIWITSNTIALDIVPFPSFMPQFFRRTTQLDPMEYTFAIRFSIRDEGSYTYAYIPLMLHDNEITRDSDMSACLGICCQTADDRELFPVGTMLYPVIVVRQNGDDFKRIGCFVPQQISMFKFGSEKDEQIGWKPQEVGLKAMNDDFETYTRVERRKIAIL